MLDTRSWMLDKDESPGRYQGLSVARDPSSSGNSWTTPDKLHPRLWRDKLPADTFIRPLTDGLSPHSAGQAVHCYFIGKYKISQENGAGGWPSVTCHDQCLGGVH